MCVDTPKGWASSTAVNCQQYAERKWCTFAGKYGTGWKKGYVSFAKWANKGVDATQACCVCGGGSTATAAGPPNETSNMEEQEQTVMGEVAQQAMSKMDEEPQNERVRVPL